MDGPRECHMNEVSQTGKEKYHTTFLMCGIENEIIQMNLLTKQKWTHRQRMNLWLLGRKR